MGSDNNIQQCTFRITDFSKTDPSRLDLHPRRPPPDARNYGIRSGNCSRIRGGSVEGLFRTREHKFDRRNGVRAEDGKGDEQEGV
jgi:hypothetical protein